MKLTKGVKIIIFSPDKILLFHRDDIPTILYPDSWQLLGGGIEKGETPKQALLREIKEEAKFDLKDYKFISKTNGFLGEEVWVYIAFVKKEEEAKFSLGPGEGQEIGWFTFDQALSLKLTPGTRILLTEYRDLIEKVMNSK